MKSSRELLLELLPHQGAMCLLDRVVTCDETTIVCLAGSHRDANNPLRMDGALPAHAVIEYAAQAMAAHGALTGGQRRGERGLLASGRDLWFAMARLDDIATDLTIFAERLVAQGGKLLYRFTVSDGAREIAGGRLAVVLQS